jgi:type II secretory pathway pseudopilin PulG
VWNPLPTLLPKLFEFVANRSASKQAQAKRKRLFAMREYVSSFQSPRIVPTDNIVEHLRQNLPTETAGMDRDAIKGELYELEGEGVLMYHQLVDAWSTADRRDAPARWKSRR